MITLITGNPGAGKTLYCVSNLLRDLVGSVIKSTDENGNIKETPRKIFTNIPGLLLDHELIGPDVGGGLADWYIWAKPGNVIVYDEVQKSWPVRPNGSKIPEYISALETHRHMGVDIILLTQNPMLLDRNVQALVGRHVHIRRFGAIGAAIAYEWDHCSRQLLFSKALKKSTFRYDKSVFKLYKSAELHIKPKNSIPPLLYIVIVFLCIAIFAIPQLLDRISGKSSEQVFPDSSLSDNSKNSDNLAFPDISAVSKSSKDAQGYDPAAFVPRVSHEPLSAPAYDEIRQVVVMPVIVGGACFKGVCRCFTAQGFDVDLDNSECKSRVEKLPFDPYTVPLLGGV